MSPPVLIGVVDAADDAQDARIINGTNIIGAEPAGFGERVGICGVAVAVGQSRSAERDAAVLDAHPHPVQRHAVVHAAARGLAHAVGANH